MNKNKKTKKTYYKINSKDAIQAAKTGQRFFARFLDLFIALLPGFLMVTIYQLTSVPSVTESFLLSKVANDLNNINLPQLLDGFFVKQYDVVVMLGWGLGILGILTNFFLIPLLNKKYKGQTLGKKLMGITPLYLKDKELLFYTLREAMIISPVILIYIFSLSGGYSVGQWFSRYAEIKNIKILAESSEITDKFLSLQAQMKSTSSIFDFMLNVGSDEIMFGTKAASSSSGSLLLTSEIFKMITYAYWIAILIFVALNGKGQSFIDTITKTAIVDLRTITSIEKAEDLFIKENNSNL